MRTISVAAKKAQIISISLGGQQCEIRLIQRPSFLYMDLTVDGVPIMQGVPCLYGAKMVGYAYLGFRGDLCFIDNEGESDPHWSGLGERYAFYYLEEADLV